MRPPAECSRPGSVHTVARMRPIPEPVHLLRVPSPIGRIELVGDDRALTALAIEQHGALPHDHLDERPSRLLDRAAAQLERYFSGSRRALSVPLDTGGTAFQRGVWERLRQLAHGETITYSTLAAAVGRRDAVRAAGTAVKANPIPLFIPCHRVLASDGGVQGYDRGEGVPTKLWLLAHEGVHLAA